MGGDDTLTLNAPAIICGGIGNDTIQFGNQSGAKAIFTAGDGQDIIRWNTGAGNISNNTLQFSDIKFKDLNFNLEGNNLKISYKTIHGSKGLESDFVILINAGNIPNKTIDDPIINLLLAIPEDYRYAEERRLFYVALTRTKSIVYILMQEEKPSVFVGEIKQDYERTEAKRHGKMSLDELIESMEND